MDTPEGPESSKQVVLNGKSVYDMLPRMKNSKGQELEGPQLPATRMMLLGIEDRVSGISRTDVCRGLVTGSSPFVYDIDMEGGMDTMSSISEGESTGGVGR